MCFLNVIEVFEVDGMLIKTHMFKLEVCYKWKHSNENDYTYIPREQ